MTKDQAAAFAALLNERNKLAKQQTANSILGEQESYLCRLGDNGKHLRMRAGKARAVVSMGSCSSLGRSRRES